MAPTRGGLVSLFAVISTEVEKSLIIPVAFSGRNTQRCLDSARHDKTESDKAHVPALQALVPRIVRCSGGPARADTCDVHSHHGFGRSSGPTFVFSCQLRVASGPRLNQCRRNANS